MKRYVFAQLLSKGHSLPVELRFTEPDVHLIYLHYVTKELKPARNKRQDQTVHKLSISYARAHFRSRLVEI